MSEKQINREIDEIINGIDKLNLGQVSELIEVIKEKYNIEETALIQPANAAAQTGEKVEEKSSNVSVKLVDIGPQKVQVYNVIKSVVKELTNNDISIVKAKELAEKEGGIILENIPQEKAEDAKKRLVEKGATVEIK